MNKLSYNIGMKNKVIGRVVILLMILLWLLLVPSNAGAKVILLQNLQPTTPIVSARVINTATTSKLMTGAFYAPHTRSLTVSERDQRIKEIKEQIAKLLALMASLER